MLPGFTRLPAGPPLRSGCMPTLKIVPGGKLLTGNAFLRRLRRAAHLHGPDHRFAVAVAQHVLALFVHGRKEDLQMIRVGIHAGDDAR